MPSLPVIYVVCAVILLILDFIWLSSSKGFYTSQMGDLLLDRPRLVPALGFYLIYAVGIAVLVVRPNLGAETVWPALAAGALLGLVAYGAYDLTNYATLRSFPLKVALVDWAWGVTVTAVTASAAWYALRWLASR
jgi:uncharacterized membrane protein